MARALRHVLDPGHLTVVVNVGDDTKRPALSGPPPPPPGHSPWAGGAAPPGGVGAYDTRKAMESLAVMGFDTTFTLGDKDLALCLARTEMLEDGMPLSDVTAALQLGLGLDDVTILPSSNDFLRTFVQIEGGEWLEFQEYFVDRSHADAVNAVAYHGAHEATAAPGVVAAIQSCDTLMVAPSNPPLSIWPILAVDEIDAAVRQHPRRVAVSPLFSGAALKGPAAEVMSGVGLAAGTRGILEAYHGFIDDLFIDSADARDIALGPEFDVAIHAGDTRLSGADDGATFAAQIIETVTA